MTLEEIRRAAERDDKQSTLWGTIQQGWPLTIKQTPLEIRKYWHFREVLTLQDGIIYKGDQIIVPTMLRSSFLERLNQHASHLGY